MQPQINNDTPDHTSQEQNTALSYAQPSQKPPLAAQILYALTIVMFILAILMALLLVYGVVSNGQSLLASDSVSAEIMFITSLIAFLLVRKIRSLNFLALKLFTGIFLISLAIELLQYFTLTEIDRLLMNATNVFLYTMIVYGVVFILLVLLWTSSRNRFIGKNL